MLSSAFRIGVLLFLALSVFFSVSCSSVKWPWGGVRISGNADGPPFNWLASDGILTGASIELASIALSGMELPFSVSSHGDWAQTQKDAEAGDLDVLVAVFKNKERERYFVFSDSYASVPVVLYVRRDKPFVFKTWDDLIGKRGGMNLRDSFGDSFDSYASAKLTISQAPLKKCFRQLIDGDLDYVVVGKYGGELFSEAVNGNDVLMVLQTPVTVQEYHMAFSRKSSYLQQLPDFNRRLRRLAEDGTVDKLTAKNILKYRLNTIAREDKDGGDDM